jgi:membrane-associated phospholipid phosphatase
MSNGILNQTNEIAKADLFVGQMFNSYGAITWLIFIFLFSPQLNYSQEKPDLSSPVPFYDLFYHLDRHLLGIYSMTDALYQLATIPITYALIKTGADWQWNNYAYNHGLSSSFAAAEAGTIAPVLIPLSLYFYGWSTDNRDLEVTGLAVGQSALLAVGIASFYKALTGRRPPNDRDVPRGGTDYSSDFHFGFLRRGAYDGWPSSHTMVAFAMASTLNSLYPDNLILSVISYTCASFIGIGVSTNIHWLSDVVAGGLIGYTIGKTVGEGFRGLKDHDSSSSSFNFSILPNGVEVSYIF